MAISADGVIEATFDAVSASVLLVVDGDAWASPVDTITVTRTVPGEAAVTLPDVDARSVIDGFWVGSDHEGPLESSATYAVAGWGSGVLVGTSTVSVSTAGAAPGMWVKVAGQPGMTVRVPIRSIGDVSSPTIGGVYQIAGGGGPVAQVDAQWSGVESDRAQVVLAASTGAMLASLRAALATARVVLLQPVGSSDLDPGWYYVSNVTRGNPAQAEAFGQRWVTLDVQRSGRPAGEGSGIAGVSWLALQEECATWADVLTTYATWFDVLKGGG